MIYEGYGAIYEWRIGALLPTVVHIYGSFHLCSRPRSQLARMPDYLSGASALVTTISCVWLLNSWRRRLSQSSPLPPGPKGLPIVGNILDMPSDEAWVTARKWGDSYGILTVYNDSPPRWRRWFRWCRLSWELRDSIFVPQFIRGRIWSPWKAWEYLLQQAKDYHARPVSRNC